MTSANPDFSPDGLSQDDKHRSARVLIVDDQRDNVLLLEKILRRAGYQNIESTTEPDRVIELYAKLVPDLVLLDLHMPHVDGLALIERLVNRTRPDDFLPILVLTADTTRTARDRALSLGAKDFLTKPFDPAEVLLRSENLIATRLLHLQLQEQKGLLEEKVRLRTWELERAQLETLERLARAAEYRDDETGEHTRRVGRIAAVVTQVMGLPLPFVDLMSEAAPLHDVGKIGIPDAILLKPARLTADEFALMRTHSTIGASLLSGGGFRVLELAEEIALSHHERWDGSGYPGGLAGETIPISGRIVSVVDVFDALTHARPYKEPWPVDEAVAEIRGQSGRQFDPLVVEAFLLAHERTDLLGAGDQPSGSLFVAEDR